MVNLTKLIKVCRVFLWIFFMISLATCIANCMVSLTDNDYAIRGLLWPGCITDLYKTALALNLFIALKPNKVKDPIE